MEAIVGRIVEMLARSDYEGLKAVAYHPGPTVDELKNTLEGYDARVVVPPPEALGELSSYKIEGSRSEYKVDVPLWIEGQGRSLMYLRLWVKLTDGGEEVRIRDIRYL